MSGSMHPQDYLYTLVLQEYITLHREIKCCLFSTMLVRLRKAQGSDPYHSSVLPCKSDCSRAILTSLARYCDPSEPTMPVRIDSKQDSLRTIPVTCPMCLQEMY